MTGGEIVLASEDEDQSWKCRLCGEHFWDEEKLKRLGAAWTHLENAHNVSGDMRLAIIKTGE